MDSPAAASPPPAPRPPRRALPRRLRAALASAALALAAVTAAPAPAAAQLLAHAPQVDRLPNGLTVVTVPFDSPGVAAYYTLVRAGSRDEVERGRTGFAHFFEHMMFHGTRAVPRDEFERRMQALGADNNAYTTEDYTLYTVTVPAASLPALVALEAERFQRLAYPEADFQTEAFAVLGEYDKSSASPDLFLEETLAEAAFTRHTYGHTTLGYLRDIQAMPRGYRYSLQFFRRFYTPDNCTIIAAGDVQRAALVPLVTQHYGGWAGRRAVTSAPVEPEQTAPRHRALEWDGASPPRVVIGYRVPGFDATGADTVALEVVRALAFSESSDLYQRLVVREQKLLALESAAQSFRRDPSLFVVDARLRAGTSFAEVEQAVADELARIGRGEYPRARIDAVVSNLRYAQPMELQTAATVADAVARFAALTGDAATLERYHQRLAAVAPDDVARVARTLLVPARRTTVTLAPQGQAEAGATRVGPRGATARRTP